MRWITILISERKFRKESVNESNERKYDPSYTYLNHSGFRNSPEYLLPVREALLRKIAPTSGCLQYNSKLIFIVSIIGLEMGNLPLEVQDHSSQFPTKNTPKQQNTVYDDGVIFQWMKLKKSKIIWRRCE